MTLQYEQRCTAQQYRTHLISLTVLTDVRQPRDTQELGSHTNNKGGLRNAATLTLYECEFRNCTVMDVFPEILLMTMHLSNSLYFETDHTSCFFSLLTL